ncbi:MAG: type III pantothenate kinase, partial [Oscillospiraceae bacterium]
MILVVDIGNTNIEFGVFEDKELNCKFRIGTNREATSDDIGLKLRQFLFINKIEIEEIEDVVIESVVPQVMYSINNAIKKYLCKNPIILGENFCVPIANKYENPAAVGADRLVNAYSALKKYGAPLIVVDFGTATTFDAVNRDGEYEGGAIFTGIRISTDALFQKTAKLPMVELAHTDKIIGKSTSLTNHFLIKNP